MVARRRRSRSTGVGRGNGAGSRTTQFQSGEPSRNPVGRPKSESEPIPTDFREAFKRALETRVPVTMNGVTTSMSQVDAMAHLLLSKFTSASVREQVLLMRMLMTEVLPPAGDVERSFVPSSGTIEDVLRDLEEGYKRTQIFYGPGDPTLPRS
jgi:hypothetical protein